MFPRFHLIPIFGPARPNPPLGIISSDGEVNRRDRSRVNHQRRRLSRRAQRAINDCRVCTRRLQVRLLSVVSPPSDLARCSLRSTDAQGVVALLQPVHAVNRLLGRQGIGSLLHLPGRGRERRRSERRLDGVRRLWRKRDEQVVVGSTVLAHDGGAFVLLGLLRHRQVGGFVDDLEAVLLQGLARVQDCVPGADCDGLGGVEVGVDGEGWDGGVGDLVDWWFEVERD